MASRRAISQNRILSAPSSPPLDTPMTLIDVHCPQCGVVYHSDRVHVGKRIKCSRCGSMVPILEGITRVVQLLADVVPPAVSARRKPGPTWLKRISAVGVVAIVALIALALLWFHFGDKPTDNHLELQSPGKIADTSSDATVSRAPKTSGDFEVTDLDTTPRTLSLPYPRTSPREGSQGHARASTAPCPPEPASVWAHRRRVRAC